MLKGILVPGKAKFKQTQDYIRSYTRNYTAEFDPDDDEEYVRTHLGFGLYASHPTAPNAYAISIELDHDEDTHTYLAEDLTGIDPSDANNNTIARYWYVTVEFGPWNPIEYPTGGNPLAMPVWPRIEFFTKEEPVYQDVDGTPCINSAGDYYETPVTRERLCLSITVARNESSVSPYYALTLSNRCNLYTWNGFPPGTVRSLPIRIPRPEYDQTSGVLYYPMEYGFEVDEKGWKANVLNQGYRQLNSSGKPVKIVDANGQELSQPAMLDSSGHALPLPINSSNILVNQYKVFPDADFSAFNLNTLF